MTAQIPVSSDFVASIPRKQIPAVLAALAARMEALGHLASGWRDKSGKAKAERPRGWKGKQERLYHFLPSVLEGVNQFADTVTHVFDHAEQPAPKQPAQWTDGHGNIRNGDIPF